MRRLALLGLFAACGDGGVPPAPGNDAGTGDAGAGEDAGFDAGDPDAGATPEPILMRPLDFLDLVGDDPTAVVDALFETKPGDAYLYGHLGSSDEAIAELRARGRVVYRYMNLLTQGPEGEKWGLVTWEGYSWTYLLEHDLFLRKRTGEHLVFPWFGADFIINWSAMTAEDLDHLLAFWRDVEGPYFCDQSWPEYAYWMSTDGTPPEDLADYDAAAWRRNFVAFVQGLDPDWQANVVLNGYWFADPPRGWDLDPEGFRTYYENADAPDMGGENREALLGETRARWRAHPGSVLALDVLSGWTPAVDEIVAEWLDAGGVLAFDGSAIGTAVALRAWEAKQRR